ncbi:hypothetical protein AB0C91_09830 [Streptomyces sp. NPDC048674]|uniref:hypothetical protein n=1 Tax=Streptomyces sp. NPDC048674 TaxID=3155491 RepID=UPI003420C11C
MDERREPEAEAGTRPTVKGVGVGKLTPLQQAWSRYVTHCRDCATCKDVDAGRCSTAEGLWRSWNLLGDHACQQMRRGA